MNNPIFSHTDFVKKEKKRLCIICQKPIDSTSWEFCNNCERILNSESLKKKGSKKNKEALAIKNNQKITFFEDQSTYTNTTSPDQKKTMEDMIKNRSSLIPQNGKPEPTILDNIITKKKKTKKKQTKSLSSFF